MELGLANLITLEPPAGARVGTYTFFDEFLANTYSSDVFLSLQDMVDYSNIDPNQLRRRVSADLNRTRVNHDIAGLSVDLVDRYMDGYPLNVPMDILHHFVDTIADLNRLSFHNLRFILIRMGGHPLDTMMYSRTTLINQIQIVAPVQSDLIITPSEVTRTLQVNIPELAERVNNAPFNVHPFNYRSLKEVPIPPSNIIMELITQGGYVVQGSERLYAMDYLMFMNDAQLDIVLANLGIPEFLGTWEDKLQFIWWFTHSSTELDLANVWMCSAPDTVLKEIISQKSFQRSDRVTLLWICMSGTRPPHDEITDDTDYTSIISTDPGLVMRYCKYLYDYYEEKCLQPPCLLSSPEAIKNRLSELSQSGTEEFTSSARKTTHPKGTALTPYRYLLTISRSPLEAAITKLVYAPQEVTAQDLNVKNFMVFPSYGPTYMLTNLRYYRRDFDRLSYPPPLNPLHFTDDGAGWLIQHYTDTELATLYGPPARRWTNRLEFLDHILAIANEPYVWSFNIPDDISIVNNGTDYDLYYGTSTVCRGYRFEDLITAFQVNFTNPWYNDPITPSKNEYVDTLREFSYESIAQLVTVIETSSYITRLVEITEEHRNTPNVPQFPRFHQLMMEVRDVYTTVDVITPSKLDWFPPEWIKYLAERLPFSEETVNVVVLLRLCRQVFIITPIKPISVEYTDGLVNMLRVLLTDGVSEDDLKSEDFSRLEDELFIVKYDWSSGNYQYTFNLMQDVNDVRLRTQSLYFYLRYALSMSLPQINAALGFNFTPSIYPRKK